MAIKYTNVTVTKFCKHIGYFDGFTYMCIL